jgi:hypothetical protein
MSDRLVRVYLRLEGAPALASRVLPLLPPSRSEGRAWLARAPRRQSSPI